MKRVIVTSVLVALSVGCASPRRGPATIAERQQQQRRSIEQGARQGDLTRDEVKTLNKGSRYIDQERRDARRDDGRIDPAERQTIRKHQRILGEGIRKNRNDDETR